jgi:hypothetical protein
MSWKTWIWKVGKVQYSIFIVPPLKEWLYAPHSFTDSVIILSDNYQLSFPAGLLIAFTQTAQPTSSSRE